MRSKTPLIVAAILLTACGSHPGFNDDTTTDAGDGATATTSPDSSTTKPDSGGSADSGGTASPTLERISGTGAIVPTQWPATDPLVVRAKDAQGNSVSGATVLYTPSQSLHIQALSGDGTVVTDANGMASTTYNAFGISQSLGHEIDTVTASWNGQSVVFTVIITQVPAGQYPASPLVTFSSPSSGHDLGSAKAGTLLSGAFVALAINQQGPDYNLGIPGWGFRLTAAGDLRTLSDVACVGTTAIADAKGNVTCDVQVPSTPGDYYFTILAGGALEFDGGHLLVTP